MGEPVPDVGILPGGERPPSEAADGDGDDERHDGRRSAAGCGASGHAVGFVGWIAAASLGEVPKHPSPEQGRSSRSTRLDCLASPIFLGAA